MAVSTVICIVLAIVAVVLRTFARCLTKAKIKADDYMIIVAVIICMGQVATLLYTVHLGAGRHVILLKDLSSCAKSIIAEEVLYYAGISTFKFSALLLFHRALGSVPRLPPVRWCLVAVILANNIAETFLSIFQSYPVHRAWDASVHGTCVNILLAACIPGSWNVISDLVTFLLPHTVGLEVHMKTPGKIQLMGISLLSGFVVIASTYRTIIVKRLPHSDASWADVDPAIWAVVENAIGIVCACLPFMRPIYSLIVCGHHCSSIDSQFCERCTAKSESSASGGSGSNRYANNSNDAKRLKGSCVSEISSVEKGPTVSEREMCCFCA